MGNLPTFGSHGSGPRKVDPVFRLPPAPVFVGVVHPNVPGHVAFLQHLQRKRDFRQPGEMRLQLCPGPALFSAAGTPPYLPRSLAVGRRDPLQPVADAIAQALRR